MTIAEYFVDRYQLKTIWSSIFIVLKDFVMPTPEPNEKIEDLVTLLKRNQNVIEEVLE